MAKKDFSLHSGERQVGRTVAEIRRDHTIRYELAEQMIREADVKEKGNFLDVFCGNGYGTFMLSRAFPDSYVEGIDGSKEAIEMAKDFYTLQNNCFSWKLYPFSLPVNRYDCVVCFESLEHVQDDLLMLDAILRSIKDDGFALVSVPNQDLHSLEINPNPFHYRHYRHSDFCEMIPKDYFVESWYGQNVYEFTREGKNKFKLLPESELMLRKNIPGQVNVYVIRKRKEIDGSALKVEQNPANRVVFIGDLCRGAQARNVALMERLFSPVLTRLGVDSSVHVSDVNRNTCLSEWLEDWKQSLGDDHESRLKNVNLAGAAVVGFEVPDRDLKYLDQIGVPWVNFAIHPIRFLDDLYFDVTTSFDYDSSAMVAGPGLIDLCVNMIRVRGLGCDEKSTPSTLAIFGQTPIDRSIYFDGCFKTLDCYLEKLDDLASKHERVLFRPHPNATNSDVDRIICERYNAILHRGEDVYELLAAGGIATVCAISSSILEEAPYFGVRAEYLEPRARKFGQPVNYRALLDDQKFWAQGLLGRMLPPVQECISRAVPAGYLRQAIESWGYVTIEKVINAKIAEAIEVARDAKSFAENANHRAQKALDLIQSLSGKNETCAGDDDKGEFDEMKVLMQRAYDAFSAKEYNFAYGLFGELEKKVEVTALLANDIAVAAYKAGFIEEAVSRFIQSADLGGGRVVVDNLIDIIHDLKSKLDSGVCRNIDALDGETVSGLQSIQAGSDVSSSSNDVPSVCNVCHGRLEKIIDNYRKCSDCGCLVFDGPAELITAQNSGSPERNELEKNLTRISRIRDRVSLGRVIDFGCGDGYFLECLRSQNIQADGVDINTELSLDDLDDDSISAFSMVEVIEHLSDPCPVIELMRKKLKAGGIIYMETTFSNNCASFPHPYVSPALGHVLVHSYESISILGKSFSFDVEFLNNNVVVMKKVG